MKVLIIDNEAPLREGLKCMLQAYCPGIQSIAEADGVESGYKSILLFQPDIVLLDVEMDDGTGFDLAARIEEHHFQLIFVTAHDKYAVDAFRFSAIDFLLKPVHPEHLQRSIERASVRMEEHDLKKQIQFLLTQMNGRQDTEKRIVLRDVQNVYFIKVKDILYCEAERTYTRFFISGHDPILVSRNLKEYESILEPLGFIRTHHSYLANPEKIEVFDKTNGGVLILENGHQVPLSQRKKETVLHWLENRIA
ncbi:MAG: response regulator transcription factor [Bacteroidetes bacterium]|nr:response regulator transcription factor [Bacteroidota bacterium]